MLFKNFSLLLSLSLAFLSTQPASLKGQAGIEPDREFRAAWVATVANIDWPSQKNLSTERQKAELITIFDTAVDINLNAIVLQVRTMADALYDSRIEPWSEFLTGEVGKAPRPYYDPLEFAVEEAHKRGLELHVWFNPYRAKHPSSRTTLSPDHVANRNPSIVREVGDHLWLDPSEEGTKNYTLNVILDLIKRYDIDGLHYDDYFYPYKSYLKGAPDFPDDKNWQAYQAGGGKLSKGDWRRNHVDDLVERLYKLVKREAPHVKVGISPFGIWKPNHPPGISGLNQYADLYADPKLWFNEGWLDYMTPQLYWPIDQKAQSYPRLLEWWAGENTKKRHLWPGNSVSSIGKWGTDEIVNQIKVTRSQNGADGNVFFSMKPFLRNQSNINDVLKSGVYARPALVPASPWLDSSKPSTPRATVKKVPGNILEIEWASAESDNLRLWALYTRSGSGSWNMQVVPAYKITGKTMRIPAGNITDIAISAVNRVGTESDRALLRVR